MKKILVLMAFLAILLAGCGQKNVSTDVSNDVSKKAHESTTERSSTKISEESTSTFTTEEKLTSTSSEVSTTTKITEATTESSVQLKVDNSLEGYSDDQIEYARVWLATMGTEYKRDLAASQDAFALNVYKQPAGTPVNPYAENSVTFSEDTIMLSGKYGYQSLVVYSSNHDGTITQYPVPSHFQNEEENTREGSQKILDGATTISIPTNNPEEVKELVSVLHVTN